MSWSFRNIHGFVWLGLGLLAGFLIAGFWPSVPLHATATDKIETFSMATGSVEPDYEAVYFLDHLTGDLHAFVIGRSLANNGGFGVIQRCDRNILQDFKTDADKTPKFLMATCLCDLNRNGRAAPVLPSRSVLYVADVTSGTATAYAIPFNSTQHASGHPIPGELVPICSLNIRQVLDPPTGKHKTGS